MDFSDPVTQQFLFGGFALVLGLSGLLLPDRYNFMKIKGAYAKHMSEDENVKIARILGAILTLIGVVTIMATMTIGEID